MADEIRFDWDEANAAHLERHNVKPEETEQVLTNEPIDMDYDIVKGEERWTSIGHTNKLRILKVVWTVRKNGTRVITATDAPKHEARGYLRAKVG